LPLSVQGIFLHSPSFSNGDFLSLLNSNFYFFSNFFCCYFCRSNSRKKLSFYFRFHVPLLDESSWVEAGANRNRIKKLFSSKKSKWINAKITIVRVDVVGDFRICISGRCLVHRRIADKLCLVVFDLLEFTGIGRLGDFDLS